MLVTALPALTQNTLWVSYEVFNEKKGFQNYYGPGIITRDKEGILWIGGDNGLYSFDGALFTNYRHVAGNNSSLPFNVIGLNFQDSYHNYWVPVYNKGLYLFNPLHGSFKKFEYPGMDRFNLHQYRISGFLDDGPLLWIVLPEYGVAAWNREKHTLQHYKICVPGSCGTYYSASWVTTITKDSLNQCYWLGSNDGLLQFRPADGSVQVYRPPVSKTTQGTYITPIINYLLAEKDSLLWCGTWGNGILRFNKNSKTFTRYLWQPFSGGTQNICSVLFNGNEFQLWVTTLDEGLLLFDKRTGQFRKVRSPEKPGEVIRIHSSFFVDGKTLYAADQNKLYRFNLDTSRFAWHPLQSDTREQRIYRGMFNFIEANNKLYTGSYYEGGFGWYDRSSNQFHPRRLTAQTDDESVLYLSKDRKGIIWINSRQGTYLYDPSGDKILPPELPTGSEKYFSAQCQMTIHTKDGSHWMATAKGLVRYHAPSGSFQVFDTLQNGKHRLHRQSVTALFEDSKGRVWIGGTSKYLYCYEPQTDSLIPIRLDFSPVREDCIFFCEDGSGNILFVLSSLGIVILEKPCTTNQRMTLCNSGNYLPTDYISTILRDHKNRIWLYTANGLLLFDVAAKAYIPFRQEDGLMSNYIDAFPYQDSTGLIYLGFSQGFQTFHPDSILKRPLEKLHIRLSTLSIDGKPWPLNPAYIADTSLELQYRHTAIAFTFAATSASLSGHHSYAWMLENYEKSWNITNENVSAQYNQLPPGNYRLLIKAGPGNGQWTSEPFALNILVLPAWYQTAVFKLTMIFLIAATVFIIFRYRLQQVRREAAINEKFHQKITELEMRSLRAQMNPHFIFNSLSSINRYIVKSDHKTASNYLTKFSKLIRLILDNSATDVISVEKEIQTLQLYLDMEALRFDHAFTYDIQVDKNIDREDTYIPAMILQPYVENAIWHGLLHKEAGKSRLIITLSQMSDSTLMAQIEDNGVGRQKAKEMKSREAVKKKSYGMQISHDRLELLNQLKQGSSSVVIEDLVNEEGFARGTRVILHIPVHYLT